MSVFALPGENKNNKYITFLPMWYDYLINIETHFVHIFDTLADILSSCLFLTVHSCSKCRPIMRT